MVAGGGQGEPSISDRVKGVHTYAARCRAALVKTLLVFYVAAPLGYVLLPKNRTTRKLLETTKTLKIQNTTKVHFNTIQSIAR